LNGLGVSKDAAEAVTWFRKAAEQNNAEAQYNLGYCYQNGIGEAKDTAEAVTWYRKAAAQGIENAKEALRRLGNSP
jgi:TPR repeat protein